MKFKILVAALCISVVLLNSCSNNRLENIFYWDQTACADPWETGPNDNWDTTASALKDYLDNQGVKAKDIEFRDNRQTGKQFCEACNCKTGMRILVVIRDKDIPKMTELEFLPY